MNLVELLPAAAGLTLFVGLWLGLSQMQTKVGVRAAVWLALAVSWTAWLALIQWLALNGAFTFRTFVPGGSLIIPTQLSFWFHRS